jgi:6-pyruvoyltetrahydropterin/6-carboxytetrahydropterin synthase
MEYRISRRFEISAAHHLTNYDGKCANLHGHNYIVEIFIKDKKLKNGMVKDYGDMKKDFEPVMTWFDHNDLNLYMEQPTAEKMAQFILEFLKKIDKRYYKVSVRETENSYCEVE